MKLKIGAVPYPPRTPATSSVAGGLLVITFYPLKTLHLGVTAPACGQGLMTFCLDCPGVGQPAAQCDSKRRNPSPLVARNPLQTLSNMRTSFSRRVPPPGAPRSRRKSEPRSVLR